MGRHACQFCAKCPDYGQLGEALAYITHYSSGAFEGETRQIKDLESRLGRLKDRNQRAKTERELNEHKRDLQEKLENWARQNNLHLDKQFLDYLSSMTEKFYYDRFEVIIIPQSNSNFGYRAILDKKWLRLQPDLLQALFGSYTTSTLTIVGQVTYAAEKSREDEPKPSTQPDTSSPDMSMRDAYEAFIDVFRAFEVITSESNKRIDLTLWPLAIYSERGIATKESGIAGQVPGGGAVAYPAATPPSGPCAEFRAGEVGPLRVAVLPRWPRPAQSRRRLSSE